MPGPNMKEAFMSIWIFAFIVPLLAAPIEKKDRQEKAHIRPLPTLQPVVEEDWEDNLFGETEIDDSIINSAGGRPARDEVCFSDANEACKERCITSEPLCMCGSNGKTYQNHCEITCMRKVDLEYINVRSAGNCNPREGTTSTPAEEIVEEVSQERLQTYKDNVERLVKTEYLKSHVKRCGKLVNCNQARHVLKYVTKDGQQSISECPEALPSFYLFTGLDCKGPADYEISKSKSDFNLADYLFHFLRSMAPLSTNYASVTQRLTEVLSNETIINCKLARRVNDKLFNKKHCAWDNHVSNIKEIINWSFDEFDINMDRQLIESELEILVNVPDVEVMLYYFKNCDSDRDGYLREDEWSKCLGCEDCFRPCNVYMAQKAEMSKRATRTESFVKCKPDGTCAPKQCLRIYGIYEQCWCVDRNCNKIHGTEAFAQITCPAN